MLTLNRIGVWLAVTCVMTGCGAPGPQVQNAPAPAPATTPTPAASTPDGPRALRQALLDELKPVTLRNCVLQRVGSANDGGYLMCGNLLDGIEVAYSYGIGGNDDWGCDISSAYRVRVHQYDCFNPPALSCKGGQFVPHAECVGPKAETVESRIFDTVTNQMAKNGDRNRRMVVKIDIEGAEWQALMSTPDEILANIDQIPMELHGVDKPEFLEVVRKLKRNFHVVHLHFNNWICDPKLEPFPAWAYQVLFVNKRIGELGAPPADSPSAASLAAPDNPKHPDCQLPS